MRLPYFLIPLYAVLTSCGPHQLHEKEPLRLATAQPLREDTVLTRDYVGQIRSAQHIEIRALERGYVRNVSIDEGQLVKEGQDLFQVMPRLYEAELQKAQAEVDFAKIEYENTLKLQKDKVVAVSELNLAKAKLDKANAELALAQTHLDFTSLKAPFDGLSGRLEVRKGSLVEEGELLTTLSDNREVWVYFNVPETEYLEFQKNMRDEPSLQVKLQMANHELYDQPGKITAIEADFNNETGNIPFRATFPNPEGLLRHGQTGNIVIEVPVENALLIPQKATYEILDKRFVYIVDNKQQIHSREVSIEAEIPDLFLVKSGLEPQEQILLDGLRKVRDGDIIAPDTQSAQEVFASLQVYAE